MGRNLSPEWRTRRRYCYGKPVYDKRAAQTAKNKRMDEGHVRLRIYNCPFCNGWHLTSQVNEKSKDHDSSKARILERTRKAELLDCEEV